MGTTEEAQDRPVAQNRERDEDAVAAKQAVRASLVHLRQALPPDERVRADVEIRRALVAFLGELRLPDDAECSVALYRAVRGEVDVWPAADELRRRGWRVYVPRVDGTARTMAFVETAVDTRWVRGAYGIPEPDSPVGTASSPASSGPCSAVTVYVVPGLGFTARGERIGYGGGYYDRWLGGQTGWTYRIGVAYACQVVDVLPVESTDVRMDCLITERGVALCRPSR
ncbi:MAG: 5-formyltetrahydrofolate cyclo-ligase [Alicyclobacillus sp.]|nr:5-formyltetrahydrofolate cyclo-ligase [Alicyclobacillus sp.]